MKQNLHSSQSLGTFPSPGEMTGSYEDKGWSSERVPRCSESSRRHMSALTPFYSGRTSLPSKWEDAERWICSPVLGYGVAKSTQNVHQKRPKSKSGPIVPPGITNCLNYSPSMMMQSLDGGCVKNFVVNSPFSTGVLIPNGVGFHYSGGGGHGGEVNVARSTSVPVWSDLVSESALPSSPDEKTDEINDTENQVTRVISRRDMATQMSPENSSHSSPPSPTERDSSPPSIPPVPKSPIEIPAKLEVREVQVDKRATMIRGSKRHSPSSKAVPDVDDFGHSLSEVRSSSWDISDIATDFSRLQREEAKIMAWENLQKAKAEASIRRLEMKLEKKRSSSMDKILHKLRVAEMKAQEMRNTVSVEQDYRTAKMSKKITLFHKNFRWSSLNRCFMSHSY